MISNTDKVIDSRDIIEELNELEDALECHIEDGGTEEDFPDIDYLNELREWNALGDNIDDWDYNALLIHESYFEEYAKDYFFEIYDVPENVSYYIDWEMWADDLMQDYTELDLSGETYYVR